MIRWQESWVGGVRIVDFSGVDRDDVKMIVSLAMEELSELEEYDDAIVDWIAVEMLKEFPELTDINDQLKLYIFLATFTLGHGSLYQKYERGVME